MTTQDESRLVPTVGRGARLLALGMAGKVVVQLVSLIVLSRLIDASAFGVVAVAVVVIGVGEVIRDAGLSAAAVRNVHLPPSQRDVLFWLNFALGVVLFAAVYLLAGLAAQALDMPQLGSVLRAMGVVFVLNGLSAQYRAGLNREMKFSSLVAADLLGPISGLLAAATAAIAGAGIWALVAQTLVNSLFVSATLMALGRWLPGLPRRGTGVRPTLRFGANVAGAQIVNHFGAQVDVLTLGVTAGAADVGHYNRASQLIMAPMAQLRSPATTLAIPTLARLVPHPRAYLSMLLKGQAVLGLTVVPIAGVIAGMPQVVVDLALGDGWARVSPVLAILAAAAAMQQVSSVANWVFVASGLGTDLRRYSTLSVLVKSALVLSCAPLGATGVAAGFLAAITLLWPIAIVWACSRAKLPWQPVVRSGLKFALLGLGCSVVVRVAVSSVEEAPVLAEAAVAALAAAVFYALAALLSANLRSNFRTILNIALRKVV